MQLSLKDKIPKDRNNSDLFWVLVLIILAARICYLFIALSALDDVPHITQQ